MKYCSAPHSLSYLLLLSQHTGLPILVSGALSVLYPYADYSHKTYHHSTQKWFITVSGKLSQTASQLNFAFIAFIGFIAETIYSSN